MLFGLKSLDGLKKKHKKKVVSNKIEELLLI